MSDAPTKSTYNEPTVMWRLRHLDGRVAHAVIIPNRSKASALWFILGSPQKARDFKNWHDAIQWVDDELTTLLISGWSHREPRHLG